MTAPDVARRPNALRLRIASAVILIPVALAAVWFGPPWITTIVGLAGLAMAWEWGRLVSGRQFDAGTALAMIMIVVVLGAAAAHRFSLALALALVSAIGAAIIRGVAWRWTAAGTMWIAGGCVAFLWLAENGGRPMIFWLLGVVWATDIFSYLFGKTIGGPRLAPTLSPNKTWAGFVGGLLGGGIAGIVAVLATGAPDAAITAISLGASLVAQGGDLAESWAKRHFAVKDTSGLIPGHGGVLDRLDGLLAATLVIALLTFVSKVQFG